MGRRVSHPNAGVVLDCSCPMFQKSEPCLSKTSRDECPEFHSSKWCLKRKTPSENVMDRRERTQTLSMDSRCRGSEVNTSCFRDSSGASPAFHSGLTATHSVALLWGCPKHKKASQPSSSTTYDFRRQAPKTSTHKMAMSIPTSWIS